MTKLFDLTARQHTSRVLADWATADPDRARRIAPQAVVGDGTRNLSLDEFSRLLGAAATSSAGVAVTTDTALRVSAVYGCVSLIAGAIASLPLAIFEREGTTRRRAEHDYWWMLNEQACDEFTSAAATEYLYCAKLFYGDGIAELLRPSPLSSRVIGWRPLHPDSVLPYRADDGQVLYRITDPKTGRVRVLDASSVIHLPSLGFDGVSSPSPVTYAAREAIGTALAGQEYTGRFFNGGATFDYALKTATKMDKDQIEGLLLSLRARNAGNRQRSPLILTGGLEPARLDVNAKDAEILSTRLFTVEEICRIFGVPPHMVGHTDKTTSWGSGIEQQGIGFVRYTLQRHLTPCAQEWNRKLWPTRARYFVEHVTAALERGDLKARYEAYRIALGRAGEQPWVDTDEIRRLENMPPNESLKTNPGGAHAQPPAATAG